MGARFIEVTSDYGPFKRWDTHENGHTRLAALKKDIDQPLAQLILTLRNAAYSIARSSCWPPSSAEICS